MATLPQFFAGTEASAATARSGRRAGCIYKFLWPVRIAYSFHQLPSFPAQVSLASIDAKLPKPYVLLCQPVENLGSIRWIQPYDEDGNAVHSCRFPNGYLLRNKTGDVSGDPFYQFDLSGSRSSPMALYFLFLWPGPNGDLSVHLSFHIFSPEELDPQAYIQNSQMTASPAPEAPTGRAAAVPATPGGKVPPADTPAPNRPAGSNLPGIEWKDTIIASMGRISGLGEGEFTFVLSLGEAGEWKIVCIPQFPQGQLIKPVEDDDPKIPIFYAVWRGLPAELRMELQRLGAAEEGADGVVLHHALEISYAFHQASNLPASLNIDRAELNGHKIPYALRYHSIGENTHLCCLRPYDEDGESTCCCRFPNGYLLRDGGVSDGGHPCVWDNPFYQFELSGQGCRVQSVYFLIVHPSHPGPTSPISA